MIGDTEEPVLRELTEYLSIQLKFMKDNALKVRTMISRKNHTLELSKKKKKKELSSKSKLTYLKNHT